MIRRAAIACSLLLLPGFAPRGAGGEPAPGIGDLAWLAGCWQAGEGEAQYAEQWMAPAADSLLGMSRTLRGGRMVGFELLRIVAREGGIDYVADPSGQEETAFRLVRAVAGELVFENPEHDFPQRIVYRRQGDGGLHARIEGTQDGRGRGVDFRMRRVECGEAPGGP